MPLPTFTAYNREASEIGLLVACKDESAVERYNILHRQLLDDERITKQFFADCINRCGGLVVIGEYVRTVAPR